MATIQEKAFNYMNRRKRVQVGNDKSPLCEEIERAYIEGYKNAFEAIGAEIIDGHVYIRSEAIDPGYCTGCQLQGCMLYDIDCEEQIFKKIK